MNHKIEKILRTKSIHVDLFELDEKYDLGQKIDVCCKKMNVIHTFKVFNITLLRGNHWLVHLQ
ncbi:hypothetical protein OCF64_28805 [Bacillus wiedmannii]|uniref:hypothetical protein n=1 Tax=Bacillus wiedmannii TaxID=1890302 RepID=UPI0021CF2D54|nr:hypothetical protein [Bacillus wiedmannii]MCU5685700.1 hypothetical protein [Bacillus wiedmannii]